jgi:hypothetical protein
VVPWRFGVGKREIWHLEILKVYKNGLSGAYGRDDTQIR